MKKLIVILSLTALIINAMAQTKKPVKKASAPSASPTQAVNQTASPATSGNSSHAPAKKSKPAVVQAQPSVNQATPPFNSGANGGAPPPKKHP